MNRALSSSISNVLLSIAMLAIVQSRTNGQTFVPGMPPGATTFVMSYFGAPVTCTGVAPTRPPTLFVFDYTINDVSISFPAYDTIAINPTAMMLMFSIDPHISLFIIAHECGHVHLPTTNESDADCFSATLGVQQGWFGPSDFPAMTAVFQNNPGNWSHPPGPVRLQHIADCMTAAANGSPLISTQ